MFIAVLASVVLMIVCFIGMGYAMHGHLDEVNAGNGVVGFGFLGMVFLFASFVIYTESMLEEQSERAVQVGRGEYSKKGERTIDDDVMFILSGNGEK